MRALPDGLQKLIPLTPAVFHVLLALSTGPMHGYAIMLETKKLSEGSFRMGPATLYSTIQRLVSLHLIDETPGLSEEDSRRRDYGDEMTAVFTELLSTETSTYGRAALVFRALAEVFTIALPGHLASEPVISAGLRADFARHS